MPIRFRCPHCSKLLGIATRKAGTAVPCPQCGQSVTVPRPADNVPEAEELVEIDQLLGHAVGSNGGAAPEPSAPYAPPRSRAERTSSAVGHKPPKPAPAPRAKPGDGLFETGDVDALLGLPAAPLPVEDAAPPPRTGGPKPVTGMDVQSLDGGNGTWVLTPEKVAVLMVAVTLLLLAAFGGGFLIASLL